MLFTPCSLASAALDQIGADELAIAGLPSQVMIGNLGMDARMGRPDLEHAVVRHDVAPAEIGRLAIADRSQNRDVDLVPELAVRSCYSRACRYSSAATSALASVTREAPPRICNKTSTRSCGRMP
jgi:hypothetical protein